MHTSRTYASAHKNLSDVVMRYDIRDGTKETLHDFEIVNDYALTTIQD